MVSPSLHSPGIRPFFPRQASTFRSMNRWPVSTLQGEDSPTCFAVVLAGPFLAENPWPTLSKPDCQFGFFLAFPLSRDSIITAQLWVSLLDSAAPVLLIFFPGTGFPARPLFDQRAFRAGSLPPPPSFRRGWMCRQGLFHSSL